MRLICSITHALGTLIPPTSSRAEYAYAGVGTTSCGKLIQDYKQNPTQVEGAMMNWAQGFMSGANISLPPSQYRDLQAMTIEAQVQSLRKLLRRTCDDGVY
jgi:hypothetical protein